MSRARPLGIVAAVLLLALGVQIGLATYLPMLCPLRRLTGLPCASCGLTRAAVMLLHGDFAGASACNIAAIPLAVFSLIILAMLILEAIVQRPVIAVFRQRFGSTAVCLAIPLMLMAWIVNLNKFIKE